MSDPRTAHTRPPGDGSRAWRLLGLTAVAVGVLLLAAVAFVLSYAGIHAVVLSAGVSPRLARLYPVIFDAMLVVAFAAVLSLRGAGLPSRCYAWLTMLVLLVAAAAADTLHATGGSLPHKPAAATAAIIPWALLLIGFGLLLSMLRQARLRLAAAEDEEGLLDASAPAEVAGGIDVLFGPRPVFAPDVPLSRNGSPVPAEPPIPNGSPVPAEPLVPNGSPVPAEPPVPNGSPAAAESPVLAEPPALAESPAPAEHSSPNGSPGAKPRPAPTADAAAHVTSPAAPAVSDVRTGEQEPETGPKTEPEARTEPEPEANTEPELEATPEPEPEATPEPEPDATPEPEPDATPEPELEATPEPELEATPEPSPAPALAAAQFTRPRSSPAPPEA